MTNVMTYKNYYKNYKKYSYRSGFVCRGEDELV